MFSPAFLAAFAISIYGFGLQQRVAAGKGEAVQVFGLQNFLNYVRHVPLGSAHGVVRLRILAARTVVGQPWKNNT